MALRKCRFRCVMRELVGGAHGVKASQLAEVTSIPKPTPGPARSNHVMVKQLAAPEGAA